MKKIIITFIVITIIATIICNGCLVSVFVPDKQTTENVLKKVPKDAEYICFVNFKQPSGEERFYIYDIQHEKFIHSGIVQHGNGKGNTKEHAVFSNAIGSGCSSLGLYKVLKKDTMHNIPVDCFRLQGLESTNSNAYKRGIVIHPSLTATLMPFGIWKTYLPLTPESKGCFAVSIHTMKVIDKYFKQGNMYLYAY